jgi:ABC-type bacteriocin/lantibiotic exporter with double-glycine peptidase domain
MSNHEPETKTGRCLVTTARALALLALLLAGSACSSVAKPQAPLSESAVRLDLPLVHQDALYDCGLASISALCQYWGVEIPAAERADLARTAEARAGLSGSELQSALEQLGFEVFLFEGSLDRTATGIFSNIDAGRPLLVMLSSDGTRHHYGLVLGYDEPHGNLILLDPMKGELLVPQPAFERDWTRCQRFTLLASRRTAASASNESVRTP